MYYPLLSETNTSRSMINNFLGYNHSLSANENESYDMKNMTSSYYPMLATRGKRATIDRVEMPLGMLMNNNDKLCYVDGTSLIYKDKNRQVALYDIGLQDLIRVHGDGKSDDGYLVESYKQVVTMGAYICIFPDNIFIDTTLLDNPQNQKLFGKLGAYFSITGDVKLTPCNKDGEAVAATVSKKAPTTPANGSYWVDTSQTHHVLKQYSETYAMWTQIPTTYIKIFCTDIGKDFEKNDGVLIAGDLGSGNNQESYIIHAKDDDYIVISGMIDTVTTIDGITVSREIPEMDFVIESNNRLWGCKYGLHSSMDKFVNEIYACKLGDPKNWNCFQGVSTDSYAASVGSDGRFTGAVTYRKAPIFFKENHIHKVYGDRPSNFQIISDNFRGVQQGSDKSLAIIDDYLFYKSISDICRYEGGQPVSISEAFGNERYDSAVAGAYKSKYYISMKNKTDKKWNLFVYDNRFGLWSREDDLQALYFNEYDGEMYCIGNNGDLYDKKLIAMNGMPAESSLWQMAYEINDDWEEGSFYSGEEPGHEDEIGEPCGSDTIERTASVHNFRFDGTLTVKPAAFSDGFNHDKYETIYHVYEYDFDEGYIRIGGDTQWTDSDREIEINPNYYYKFAIRQMHETPDEPNVYYNVRIDRAYSEIVEFIFTSKQVKEEDIQWYAETGVTGYSLPDSKYVSRLNMRLILDIGSTVTLDIQYDSDGNWEHLYSISGKGTKSFPISIRPRRCDHFKLKISGTGECKIISMTKVIEQGSDET